MENLKQPGNPPVVVPPMISDQERSFAEKAWGVTIPKADRPWKWLVGIALCVLLVGAVAMAPQSPPTTSADYEASAALADPAGYLARANRDYGGEGDQFVENRFRVLLERLDEKYPDTQPEIALATVTAAEMLKHDGVKEQPLEIMESINKMGKTGYEGDGYKKLVTLMANSVNQINRH